MCPRIHPLVFAERSRRTRNVHRAEHFLLKSPIKRKNNNNNKKRFFYSISFFIYIHISSLLHWKQTQRCFKPMLSYFLGGFVLVFFFFCQCWHIKWWCLYCTWGCRWNQTISSARLRVFVRSFQESLKGCSAPSLKFTSAPVEPLRLCHKHSNVYLSPGLPLMTHWALTHCHPSDSTSTRPQRSLLSKWLQMTRGY